MELSRSPKKLNLCSRLLAVMCALLSLVGAANLKAQVPRATGPSVQSQSDNVNALREAADRGGAGAQDALGYLYAQGQGVAQDYAQGNPGEGPRGPTNRIPILCGPITSPRYQL